jgi:hypothetical protein
LSLGSADPLSAGAVASTAAGDTTGMSEAMTPAQLSLWAFCYPSGGASDVEGFLEADD